MTSLAVPGVLRRLRRRILARRRLLAALCAGLAVAAALQAHAAPPPPRTSTLTAARDLPPGHTLTSSDLAPALFAPASVPDGVLATEEAVGRTTVGPIRAGEPLTDVRVLGDGLLEHYPGAVAAPVRIGDAAAADLLQVGDRVTLLAADPQSDGPAVSIAEAVPVLAVPPRRRADPGLVSGALIVLAVDATTARQLAGAGTTSFLSVVIVR